MRGDGGLVAAGRAVAPNVTGLYVRGGGNELVAVPHAGGEPSLIVGSIFPWMRTAIHIYGHRRARFPRTDHPSLHLTGDGIRYGPHPQAERSSGDMPLGLEPADALRHGNDRLR